MAIHWISWTNARISNQAMFTWLDWKKCQCKSNVWIGKTLPFIGFLGPMYGPMYSFPIKPCKHGLIGRNANQKSNVRAEKL
jgi:hypothetical protein